MPYGRKCAFNQPYINSKAYHVRIPWLGIALLYSIQCFNISSIDIRMHGNVPIYYFEIQIAFQYNNL